MRAPFNTTVTLYDGPGTATPGFPRIVDAPARLVNDQYFVDFSAPLNASSDYFTMEVDEPRASVNTPIAAGKWEFDFTKADRAEFAALPGVIWVVIRAELCTWPVSGAPYWRASITLDDAPPVACSDAYPESFSATRTGGSIPPVLTRTGTLTWADTGFVVTAETTATAPDCVSTWTITDTDGNEWTADYNGIGFVLFTRVTDPTDQIALTPIP